MKIFYIKVDGKRLYYSGCFWGMPKFQKDKKRAAQIPANHAETVLRHLQVLQSREIYML